MPMTMTYEVFNLVDGEGAMESPRVEIRYDDLKTVGIDSLRMEDEYTWSSFFWNGSGFQLGFPESRLETLKIPPFLLHCGGH